MQLFRHERTWSTASAIESLESRTLVSSWYVSASTGLNTNPGSLICIGIIVWGIGVIRSNNTGTTLTAAGFTDPSNTNYMLAPTSHSINAGKIIAPYTNGYLGWLQFA